MVDGAGGGASVATKLGVRPASSEAIIPRIELRNVARRYETGGGTVTALADVNLTIGAGEFVVMLGPSGSGKTTLLNLIGALDVPTEGDVIIEGRSLRSTRRPELFAYRRSTVSFVFQTFNLFPGLTAFENVRFGADAAHRPHAAQVVREVLASVGLEERMHHFPEMLSGGEQQRVAIARALATGNQIILADEPTGELDVETGREILKLLRAQADDGRTVIVVTHNREIARVADRVIELSGGRVVSDRALDAERVAVDALRW
jgi:putative ABC transport system ATP-binding protein